MLLIACSISKGARERGVVSVEDSAKKVMENVLIARIVGGAISKRETRDIDKYN